VITSRQYHAWPGIVNHRGRADAQDCQVQLQQSSSHSFSKTIKCTPLPLGDEYFMEKVIHHFPHAALAVTRQKPFRKQNFQALLRINKNVLLKEKKT
jgi:hypothetical protein